MSNLKILVVDDEQLICWSFKQQLDHKGYDVYTADSAEEGLVKFEKESPEIVFIDNRLPNMQGLDLLTKIKEIESNTYVVFMTAFGTIETAVEAMKRGAYDYINKPFTFEEIHVILKSIREKIELENNLRILKREQFSHVNFDNIVGQSEQMKEILQLSKKIAKSEATTVLLLGESGTGKDLLARAIHNESNRSHKSFVTINCSSVPETLLESELFGHEKGAFTNAHKQKKGLFEIADGGTVFLDEIGEVSLGIQVKLLSIIEYKMFRRVGGTKDINVDIRIIAATNKNLQDSIKENKFRYDLYYRIKVFQLTLPPLRERPEDIPLLIDHFIKGFNVQFRKNIKGVTPEAEELLMQYDWPGNVRELRNVIERAIILQSGEYIRKEDLPCEINLQTRPSDVSDVDMWFQIPDEGFSLFEVEKKIIEQTLRKVKQNQSKAAKMMGISRDRLRYKMKKYNIRVR